MPEEKELQIENGNYTRIVNKVIDELVKQPLLGVEIAICLFVIRKTWGYKKTSDQISLSQFQSGIKRSRPTIIKALKNLQVVNILQLVKVGLLGKPNVWKFNKYTRKWRVVNTPLLVKDRTIGSKEKLKKLVKVPLHTKDNTKDNIQKKERDAPIKTTNYFFSGVRDLIEHVDSESANKTKEFLSVIHSNYPKVSKQLLWNEVKKFYNYWTEKTHSGRYELWQTRKTFEVGNRLATWFSRQGEFEQKQVVNIKTKGKKIII
jgi:hypothetical protein